MDLLKTILLYLTMVFVSSVQTVPEPSILPETPTPVPMATVATATATPSATPKATPVPTPNITPNNEYRTVKVGDKGEPVKLLQRRLAELNYYSGEIDGVFGNQTRRAVERFQYYQGLSVDGIAGKRTQTILYESADVVIAPVDVSPSPSASVTPKPTDTPAPTFVPAPTATLTVAPTAADAPTVSAEINTVAAASETPAETATGIAASESAAIATPTAPPTLNMEQEFVLLGSAVPMTLAPTADATAEPVLLRPLQVGELVYAPLLEILRNAGSVLIPGNSADRQETAFSLLNDVYQISYAVDATGAVVDLTVLKNQTPLPLSLRHAIVLDGVLYLPMTVSSEITQITFTLNEAATQYEVTLPALPQT